MIDAWQERIIRGLAIDTALALETAGCARLVRGYGDTHQRGVVHFERIVTELIDPAIEGKLEPALAARQIAAARDAALEAPELTA